MDHTADDLFELALEVRTALEGLSLQNSPSVLAIEKFLKRRGAVRGQFPSDWCDFASIVLASHLARENYRCRPTIVIGEREQLLTRHWWVEVGGFVIDITCDQFVAAPKAPHVSKRSLWHRRTYPQISRAPHGARLLQCEEFELLATSLLCAFERRETVKLNRVARAFTRCLERQGLTDIDAAGLTPAPELARGSAACYERRSRADPDAGFERLRRGAAIFGRCLASAPGSSSSWALVDTVPRSRRTLMKVVSSVCFRCTA